MIGGFTPATGILEERPDRAYRGIARALAAKGYTVTEIANKLGVSPVTAWWLSDYRAKAA